MTAVPTEATTPSGTVHLHLSSGPFVRYGASVRSVMLWVLVALAPACAASVVYFRVPAVVLIVTCVSVSVAVEWLIAAVVLRTGSTIGDFSAVVSGLLLALTLPPATPPVAAGVAAAFSMAVAKWAFGGLGCSVVNPALAGRALIMLCFPAVFAAWTVPALGTLSGLDPASVAELSEKIDGFAQATPRAAFGSILHALQEDRASGAISFSLLDFEEALPRLFTGARGGCLGETSALALLLGAGLLWYRRIIGIRIPTSFIGSVLLLSWLFNGSGGWLSTEAFTITLCQVLSGGLLLGALFMATDPCTSPMTSGGKMLYGLGCGVLTVVLRQWGGATEGVCWSILTMNFTVPLLDHLFLPRPYGKVRSRA